MDSEDVNEAEQLADDDVAMDLAIGDEIPEEEDASDDVPVPRLARSFRTPAPVKRAVPPGEVERSPWELVGREGFTESQSKRATEMSATREGQRVRGEINIR